MGGIPPGQGHFAVTAESALTQGLRGLAGVALNALLPPRCLSCEALVERPGSICSSCWREIHFISTPLCPSCGYPFEVATEAEVPCAACLRERPPYARARAVMRYDDASKGQILRFKHADRCEAAPAFALWMQRAGAELLADADVVAPVPLHWFRLFQRRYNQAALLARELGKLAGIADTPDLLVRRRATPSQGHLSPDQRRRNVAGAFVVPPRRRARVQGKRVLLVDDVLTTGATVGACARALKRAGAAEVDVLTLARIARPRP